MKPLGLALMLAFVVGQPALADPAPAPAITLVTAGKGPTQALRFIPTKGTKRTIVTTVQDSSARGLRGTLPPLQQTPAIRTVVDLEVTDVTPGEFRYDFVFKRVEVVADKTMKPAVVSQLNGPLQVLAGLKGHAVVTSRGIVKESELVDPPAASPELRQTLNGLRSIISQAVAPLPDEPVGVGARWTTSIVVKAGELTVQQKASTELVELAGTRVRLAIVLEQQGKGSGPGNLTTKLVGRGEISFDLTSLGPDRARVETHNEVELDFEGKRLVLIQNSAMTIADH